jgi:Protein of unknown function (DUF3433)
VQFNRPFDVVPRRPDPVGAIAVILTSSQRLQNVLADLGRSPTKDLGQRLSPVAFSSQVTRSDEKSSAFAIETAQTEPSPNISGGSSTSRRWHRPLSTRKGFIMMILAAPIIFITILEGLQQSSNRHQGFLTLKGKASGQSSSTTIVIRYITALLMLLLATCLNMLDFTVSNFAPFGALRAGSSLAQRSIFSRLVGQVPPVSLYHGAGAHHWGALCATLADLSGSLLAIIVSGLLVVENANLATGATVEQLDACTIDAFNADSGDSTATLSLIEQFNLSFPAFTSEGLALPRIKLREEDSPLPLIPSEAADVSLSLQVPALRASLDCEQLSRDDIDFTFEETQYDRPGPAIEISARIAFPDGCGSPTTTQSFAFTVANGEKPTLGVLMQTMDSALQGNLPGSIPPYSRQIVRRWLCCLTASR